MEHVKELQEKERVRGDKEGIRMNQWIFNDISAQSLHRLLGVRQKVFIYILRTEIIY